ncbi:MAG: hypothetical protein ABSA52_11745 [Candidatus Binatia bacterium]|jgi:hypothetical protein
MQRRTIISRGPGKRASERRSSPYCGTVPTGMQRLEAAVVTRSTLGVCSVQDDLRIVD